VLLVVVVKVCWDFLELLLGRGRESLGWDAFGSYKIFVV